MQQQPDDPGPSGGAPELPDAVPGPVQDLLDGIWSAGGAVGDTIRDLAKAIGDAVGGEGSEAAHEVVALAIDALGVLS